MHLYECKSRYEHRVTELISPRLHPRLPHDGIHWMTEPNFTPWNRVTVSDYPGNDFHSYPAPPPQEIVQGLQLPHLPSDFAAFPETMPSQTAISGYNVYSRSPPSELPDLHPSQDIIPGPELGVLPVADLTMYTTGRRPQVNYPIYPRQRKAMPGTDTK